MDETTRLQPRDSAHRGNIWTERTGLEKLLFAFVLVVIIISIALSISLATYKRERCQTIPDAQENICQTSECVTSAAYLISAMNSSVDPCEDFFSFACGGFVDKTFLLGDRTGRLSKLSIKILLRMKDLLEEPFSEDDPEHWNKSKEFYKKCMDLAPRQILASDPLKVDLEKLGGWPLLDDSRNNSTVFWTNALKNTWDYSTFSWTDTLKKMFDLGYEKDILIKIGVEFDFNNSSKSILLVDQPHLSMPRTLYLLEYPHDYALRAYKVFIEKCGMMLKSKLDISSDSFKQQLDDAVDIERRLAEASLPDSERKDIIRLFENHTMTFTELKARYNAIPWDILFQSFLPKNVTLTDEDKIWVPVPSVIEEFQKILTNKDPTNIRKLANYMMYRVVLMAAPDLNHFFVQSFYDFKDILKGKPFTYPDPWQTCIEITHDYFYYSLSSVYTKKYFQEGMKENVSSVERNIRKMLEDEIKDAYWIDDMTQNEALLKAQEMTAIIGYPEAIMNDTLLNEYFTELQVGKSYYENVREANKFYELRDMAGLHEEYNKHKWESTGDLLVANAYYSGLRNTITIPVGVLQEETYSPRKPNYLNYGSLGMLLGHELTHGFDMSGGQFDEKGNLKHWWKEDSFKKLKNRSQCFIDQYDSYAVPGTGRHVNGTLTLNENMADTGGVHTAYKAYQRWVAKHGEEKLLPGLSYTPNQLFWLSVASIWCNKETPQYLKFTLRYQVHAPPQYRVRGIVSNLKEFSTDFNCEKESPMNPNTKCLLWT